MRTAIVATQATSTSTDTDRVTARGSGSNPLAPTSFNSVCTRVRRC